MVTRNDLSTIFFRWIFVAALMMLCLPKTAAQEAPTSEVVASFEIEIPTESSERYSENLLWSKDSSRIVIWELGGSTIQVWSPTEGLVASMVASGYLLGVEWNPQETMLLSWGVGETAVKVWNMQGHLLYELQHSDLIKSAEWCCNDQGIFTVSRDGGFYLWNLDGTERAHYFQGTSSDEDFQSWAWNADFSQLVTSSANYSLSAPTNLKLWNASGVLQATLNLPQPPGQIVWSPDGQYFVSYYSDTAYLWAKDGTFVKSLQHYGTIRGLTWKPTSDQILTWSADTTVRLWNVKGELEHIFLHKDTVISAQWSHDFKRLLTTSWDGTVWVWTVEGELIASMKHEPGTTGVLHVYASWSADEGHILSVTNEEIDLCNMMKIECLFATWFWDDEGHLISMLPGHSPVSAPIWIDETRFVIWTSAGVVQIRDGQTGETLETLLSAQEYQRDWILAIHWNEDLKQLLVWTLDGTITIWKLT